MNKYIKEKIEQGMLIVIAIVLGITLLYSSNEGFRKHEINECNNWAKMAEEHKNFYLTQNQVEQCNFLNIEVNAPIK